MLEANQSLHDNAAMHSPARPAAWLRLGFRPFFLAAAMYSALSVILWTALYTFGQPLATGPVTPAAWHGHEMLFGYTLAVISGFLLTAIANWTGQKTVRGTPLLGLLVVWLAARLLFLLPEPRVLLLATSDLLFGGLLVLATAVPIIRARQWKQIAILAKLLLLIICNLFFYLGVSGRLPGAETTALYAGVYLVVSLILMIGRRVLPSFTENGVDYAFTARNRRWLDISSMFLFIAFALADLFIDEPRTAGSLAAVLVALHLLRLHGWYTPGILRKPLLWVLYAGYIMVVLGFAMNFLSAFAGVSPWLALHAFTYGGIGMMTLGMMARVTLGHTGRDVFNPPASIGAMFALLGIGALFRILAPAMLPQYYPLWVGLSQLLWISAFGWFLVVFVPMLVSPRIDGKDG